jgi:hypothetical protein
MRFWLRHLQSERGIALITAVGMLGVLTLAAGTLTVYTTSNSRSAQGSKAQEVAYSLAEAGIGQSLSILHAALDPRTGNLLPSTTVALPGGNVTYSGTLDTSTYTWTITSIGKATNPNNSTNPTQRVLTKKAVVRGLMNGATVGAWSRIYHNNTTYCLDIDSVNFPESVSSAGDICLMNGASITGTDTKVSAGDDITLTPLSTSDQEAPATASGWTSSTNVASSNDSDATTSIAGSSSSVNLNATNFGVNVPTNATITGIRARIERAASATSSLSDMDVFLLKAGNQAGNDKAAAGTWGTTDATATYGSSTDLWGTTWTPADVNNANFGLRLKVQNANASSRTASVDYMELTVYYTIQSYIGTSGTPIANADVSGTCQLGTNTAHSPCSATDNVYADEITTTATDMTKPTIDLPYWYQNARPGPKNNCTTGSFPGGFDNDGTYNYSRASVEVTPTGSDYSCQFRDNTNTLVGEISWNHTTHVLKVMGTIFFDGDFRFDDDGQLVNYQGRAIIYATGDIEFDELVCAGGNGTRNCITDGMQNWDPVQNMLIVLSGDDSEYDQGATQAQNEPSGLQGIVYAKDDCTIHENFYSSGPLLCDRIVLPSAANGWPHYYTWPDLGTLIEGQMYGSASTAADFQLEVGAQSG